MQKKWTNQEINTLKKFYPINGMKWCIEKLNRSQGSIREKASVLGLKQDRSSSFFWNGKKERENRK